ncbi:5583_t:CDS:2 [Dentiscutata erythropus]|uniref:5583_t:CDS:1 n=1 Tax=Dentiscutata erythropus TaxID=1348616 RepID=A0A9N8WN34_9GLOM|nr:5583_t:CDS:2 [Dentiscutata erythropus]
MNSSKNLHKIFMEMYHISGVLSSDLESWADGFARLEYEAAFAAKDEQIQKLGDTNDDLHNKTTQQGETPDINAFQLTAITSTNVDGVP